MMATPCEQARWLHDTREAGALPPLHHLPRLPTRSLRELEDELSATGRHDDQPAVQVGGIRLRMAPGAERPRRSRSKSEPAGGDPGEAMGERANRGTDEPAREWPR